MASEADHKEQREAAKYNKLIYVSTDQIKPTPDIVFAKAIKALSSDSDTCIELTRLPLDSFCKEFHGLLLKPL
jgi:hypothetical protein